MKKLLLSLGALSAVVAPVAAVVACGSTTPEAKDEVKVGAGTVSFEAKGFEVATSWNADIKGVSTPESRNGLFSATDPATWTPDQKIDFLDRNFPKKAADGTESEVPRSFWTDKVSDTTIAYTFVGSAIANKFVLSDISGQWVIGNGKALIAIEATNPTISAATDEEKVALNTYIAKKDPSSITVAA